METLDNRVRKATFVDADGNEISFGGALTRNQPPSSEVISWEGELGPIACKIKFSRLTSGSEFDHCFRVLV